MGTQAAALDLALNKRNDRILETIIEKNNRKMTDV